VGICVWGYEKWVVLGDESYHMVRVLVYGDMGDVRTVYFCFLRLCICVLFLLVIILFSLTT